MKKHNQKGFGAVGILVVILVLCLVGGAVWFVLNNKKDSKDTSATSQSSSQASTSKPGEASGTVGYLTIEEWGIKLPLSDKNEDAYYTLSADKNSATVSLRSVTDNGCTGADKTSFGSLMRSTTDEFGFGPGYGHKVGEYYYAYSARQQGCDGSSDAINKKLSDATLAFYEAIGSVKASD